MIKCGVCGSENEAAALFCGTCGSPLAPADATATVDDATKPVTITPEPDEEVVPGKDRGARRDLGTGGLTTVVPDGGPKLASPPEEIADVETTPGGLTITCGVCGTVNDASRTYCRKCANELKPAPPPPPPPPPTPVRRTISPLALGLGAGAVVVAIVLVAVLAMGGGNATPTGTLAASAQATTPAASVPVVEPSSEPTILPTPTARTFTEGKVSGRIAFARCPSDGSDCAIYLRPADLSAKATRIIGATNASALDPAISPDGKKIIYVVEPGLRIVTISTRTFVQHSTGSGDTNPTWAKDGKLITFAGHRNRDNSGDDLEIRTDTLKSTSSKPLTDNDLVDHDPVFTPDGKSIIFVQGEGDSRELKKIDVASGEITDLTTDSFADEDPAVSPDGTEVVFASKRVGDEFDLFILNLATGEVTNLPPMPGDEHDPAWSPGGRYIVFSADGEQGKDLFILDLSNMSRTLFTSADGADLTPSWR